MASACCSDPDRAADPMARVVGASRPGASVSRLSRLGRCAAIRAASVAALGVVAYGIRLLL